MVGQNWIETSLAKQKVYVEFKSHKAMSIEQCQLALSSFVPDDSYLLSCFQIFISEKRPVT